MQIEGSYATSKIKPKKTSCEGYLFDSELEAYVYSHLRLLFPKDWIKIHVPISLFPSNKHFPAYSWRCDFQILIPGRQSPIYIEAKGLLTEEFRLTLKAVAASRSDVINNLIVVHPKLGLGVTKQIQTLNLRNLYAFLASVKSKY